MTETTLSVVAPTVDVHEKPEAAPLRGKLESQLVYGETFNVAEENGGWAKGACGHDHYTGYVEARVLKVAPAATHVITAARTHLHETATLKSPLKRRLSFGSRIRIAETGESWSRLEDGDWIYNRHIIPVGTVEEDYLSTAKKFLETPYYWGGRSGFGIDCSGLVQVCLGLAGIKAPRDTEQQITLGTGADRPRAMDLVFFPGHVGIMVDADEIIHANAFHMKVAIEPLWMVEERSKEITAIRRLA